MTRMAPLLRWRKRGNVSAPSPPTFYYRRGTFDLGVLLPQQLQRDAVALELAVDVRAVGSDPVVHRGGAGKQPGLERRVVQLGRQRRAEPPFCRLLQIAGTVPALMAQAWAIARWGNPWSCLSRSTSRIFLISSLGAGIASPSPFEKGKACRRSGYRRAFTMSGMPEHFSVGGAAPSGAAGGARWLAAPVSERWVGLSRCLVGAMGIESARPSTERASWSRGSGPAGADARGRTVATSEVRGLEGTRAVEAP